MKHKLSWEAKTFLSFFFVVVCVWRVDLIDSWIMKGLEAGERCLKSLKKRILINEEIKQVIFSRKTENIKNDVCS